MIGATILRAIGKRVMRSGNRSKLSILIYHRVLPERDGMLPDEIDASAFCDHMDALTVGFNVLPLSEAVTRLQDGTLPERTACITFDDGYANNATIALPILQERSLPACFFISTKFLDGSCMWNDAVMEALRSTRSTQLDLTDLELGNYELGCIDSRRMAMVQILSQLKVRTRERRDEIVNHILDKSGVEHPTGMMMTPAQVKLLVDAEMEIGGHTVNHPILSTLTADQARAEIREGKEVLESITQRPVRLFAYPNGRPGEDFTEEHVAMLREMEFDAAVTTQGGTASRQSDPLLLPRFTPWDRTRTRFTLRLFQNALLNN